jgi:GNAT superfamily N-acetyltransferase
LKRGELVSQAAVEIVPVRDRGTAREFLELPYRLHRAEANWVPPLRIAQKELFDPRHPFYLHGTVERFLARRDGRTVGRIAAILDPNYSAFQSEKAGFFGFLETEEDQGAATALLDTAREWLTGRGAEVIRGPVNPSTNYECGTLVEGFEHRPMVMMSWNPAYYPRLIDGAGWRKAKDLLAYDLPVTQAQAERVDALTAKAEKSGMRIRSIRMEEFDKEADLIWGIYTSAWSANWGFVPMSQAEFRHTAKEMKQILKPELVLFGEVDGRPAGFAVALPDINEALRHAGGRLLPFGLLKILWHQRKIRRLRVLLLGVKEEFRATAVAAGLYANLIRQCWRTGFEGAECSWVLEDNVLMRRSIEALGGTVTKRYRIYEWDRTR